MAMLTLVGFYLLLRQCKFLQQVLAGHRPQSTEAERLRDQSRDPRKFQGNTRAVLQLLTLISRHRLLSRWGPFLDAVNITIEALTTKTLPSPAAAIEDGRRDYPISAPRTGRRVCRTRFTERRMRRQYSRRRAVRDSEAQSTWADARTSVPAAPCNRDLARTLRHPAALGRSDCFR
jgi:hypothetical protein